jgi:DNA repair photolyase
MQNQGGRALHLLNFLSLFFGDDSMENFPVQYLPISCKSALHSVQGGFPYKSDLNIFRGCENGCKYCFAIYSHKYMKPETNSESVALSDNYYNHIYVKTNIVEQLEKELSRPSRKREVINLGGVCDSYQAAEAEFSLMPDILKLMIKYKNPFIISTKSDLILRDFDLIEELAETTFVNVAATITTADEKLQKIIEPGAVSPQRRFGMLQKFKKTNATIGIHTMPTLPLLTDSPENFESVFSKSKEVGADYIIVQPLYLRGQTRAFYFDFIQKEFPELYTPLKTLYKRGGLDKEYKSNLFQNVVYPMLKKYGLSTDYMKSVRAFESEMKKEKELKQTNLFQFE